MHPAVFGLIPIFVVFVPFLFYNLRIYCRSIKIKEQGFIFILDPFNEVRDQSGIVYKLKVRKVFSLFIHHYTWIKLDFREPEKAFDRISSKVDEFLKDREIENTIDKSKKYLKKYAKQYRFADRMQAK